MEVNCSSQLVFSGTHASPLVYRALRRGRCSIIKVACMTVTYVSLASRVACAQQSMLADLQKVPLLITTLTHRVEPTYTQFAPSIRSVA